MGEDQITLGKTKIEKIKILRRGNLFFPQSTSTVSKRFSKNKL